MYYVPNSLFDTGPRICLVGRLGMSYRYSCVCTQVCCWLSICLYSAYLREVGRCPGAVIQLSLLEVSLLIINRCRRPEVMAVTHTTWTSLYIWHHIEIEIHTYINICQWRIQGRGARASLNSWGIDFYSGFIKNVQGGVCKSKS